MNDGVPERAGPNRASTVTRPAVTRPGRPTAPGRPWHRLAALLLSVLPLGCSARAASRLEVPSDDSLLAEAQLDEERQLWASAPLVRSAWIPLGPNGTVAIHHGLGSEPLGVQVYVSFTQDDRDDTSTRRFSPAAGDVANVTQIDDEVLELYNNTRGQFYVRVLLQ